MTKPRRSIAYSFTLTCAAVGAFLGAAFWGSVSAAQASSAVPSAAAACGANVAAGFVQMPSVEKLSAFVAKRHQGDWGAFRTTVQSKRDGAVVALRAGEPYNAGGSRGLLTGDDLKRYAARYVGLLSMADCIVTAAAGGTSQENASAEALANFETAAGGVSSAASEILKSRMSKDTSAALGIQIETECRPDMAIFEITNMRQSWTKSKHIEVIRVHNGDILSLSQRRMRLALAQTFRFRMDQKDGAEYWLAVSDQAHKQEILPDSRLTCS